MNVRSRFGCSYTYMCADTAGRDWGAKWSSRPYARVCWSMCAGPDTAGRDWGAKWSSRPTFRELSSGSQKSSTIFSSIQDYEDTYSSTRTNRSYSSTRTHSRTTAQESSGSENREQTGTLFITAEKQGKLKGWAQSIHWSLLKKALQTSKVAYVNMIFRSWTGLRRHVPEK